jgi:hypothetical protein
MTNKHRNTNNVKNNDNEAYSLYGYVLQLLCCFLLMHVHINPLLDPPPCPSPCPLLLFKLLLLVIDLVLFRGLVLV